MLTIAAFTVGQHIYRLLGNTAFLPPIYADCLHPKASRFVVCDTTCVRGTNGDSEYGPLMKQHWGVLDQGS